MCVPKQIYSWHGTTPIMQHSCWCQLGLFWLHALSICVADHNETGRPYQPNWLSCIVKGKFSMWPNWGAHPYWISCPTQGCSGIMKFRCQCIGLNSFVQECTEGKKKRTEIEQLMFVWRITINLWAKTTHNSAWLTDLDQWLSIHIWIQQVIL